MVVAVVVALLHVSGGPLISFKLGLRFSSFSLGASVRRLGEWALEEERRKKIKKKKRIFFFFLRKKIVN